MWRGLSRLTDIKLGAMLANPSPRWGYQKLVIAGGAGGAGPGGGGAGGQTGTAGGSGYDGAGGTGGSGGQGSSAGGTGGGGFTSNGTSGFAYGGASFANGLGGGSGFFAGSGGFGGGGGGSAYENGAGHSGGGGGGGGYSGGGGPNGGGGGSLDGGTQGNADFVKIAGENSGKGSVVITPIVTLKTDPVTVSVPEGQTTTNLYQTLAQNVQDSNPGAQVLITNIGQSNTMGFAYLDKADGLLTYTADGYQPSATQPQDSFTYTAQDQYGQTVTGTVALKVTGASEPTQVGTAGTTR